MAIVSGDVGALIQMAQGGQLPVPGRSLSRKKKPKQQKLPRGSVADLTAALGQAGLQLPVECGCDCSCDVQDVGPMVATPPPPPSLPPTTAVNSEAPAPPSTTTTKTTTTETTTTTPTEPG